MAPGSRAAWCQGRDPSHRPKGYHFTGVVRAVRCPAMAALVPHEQEV